MVSYLVRYPFLLFIVDFTLFARECANCDVVTSQLRESRFFMVVAYLATIVCLWGKRSEQR